MSTTKTLGPVTATARGFPVVRFADHSGVPCSLQASSLAEYETPGTSAVWLGVTALNPQVMVSEAHLVGLSPHPLPPNGWMPFPIPAQVHCNDRMHLDRKQVAALIKHLQRWLDRDTF